MKEEEIRPKEIFDEYLRLAAEDAQIYFGNSKRIAIDCPACGGDGQYVFSKHGFEYDECPDCQSLYVNPRPPVEDFFHYYTDSASAKFFATTFYKVTAEARRLKLWKPKAELIHKVLCERECDHFDIYDVGGGYGIFAEEYERLSGSRNVTVIEPGPHLAQVCRNKGFPVIQSFLEDVAVEQVSENAKAFVSFELFEHLHDPGFFLDCLSKLMTPGDLFIFTTLSSAGLDLQLLWDKSNSISLQHLNFFNPRSIKKLLQKKSFNVISVATPGKLDMDIILKNRNYVSDRFWRNLTANLTQEGCEEWQKFISDHGYSSHMLVICERA